MSDSRHPVAEKVTAVAASSFRGPIPPPDALARYERICPGFAERIIALAEREAENRQRLERDSMRIAENDAVAARLETKHGQNLAFWITIVAFLAAVICAYLRQPWVAGVIAGTTLASIVSSIMRKNASER